MLKIVRLVAIPTKAICITAVKKIPELLLFIIRNKVEDLIATAGGEIKEGLRERNIHTVAHKEFLNAKIYHGNLIVMLSEYLRSMLKLIYSVMHESFVYSAYSVCQRKGAAHEINVLKDVKLGGEENLLLLYKRGAEELIPNVARGALKNEIGKFVL